MSLILVVDDESDVEMLFRQQFRRELRAGASISSMHFRKPLTIGKNSRTWTKALDSDAVHEITSFHNLNASIERPVPQVVRMPLGSRLVVAPGRSVTLLFTLSGSSATSQERHRE